MKNWLGKEEYMRSLHKALLLYTILFIGGCSLWSPFDIGKGVKNVGVGVGAAYTGSALNNVGKSFVEEEKTAQLHLEKDAEALQLAVHIINNTTSPTVKYKLALAVLHTKETLDLSEQKTKQYQYIFKAVTSFLAGVLTGFILCSLAKTTAGIGRRVKARVN